MSHLSAEERCSAEVRVSGTSWPRWTKCQKKATVEREGRHYCGTHDPVRKAERDKARSEQSNAKFEERSKQYRLEAAAPEMLELIRLAHRAEWRGFGRDDWNERAFKLLEKFSG